MRFAIVLLCLAGCGTDQDAPLPVRLAAGDAVGTYEAGVLQLEKQFVASFGIPLSIAAGRDEHALDEERSVMLAQPLAVGDTVELVLSVSKDVADRMPLLVSEPSSLLDVGVELSNCGWLYSTERSTGTGAPCAIEDERRITIEYLKHWTCSCADCWERYGGATWCE